MSVEDNKAIVARWFAEFWGPDYNPDGVPLGQHQHRVETEIEAEHDGSVIARAVRWTREHRDGSTPGRPTVLASSLVTAAPRHARRRSATGARAMSPRAVGTPPSRSTRIVPSLSATRPCATNLARSRLTLRSPGY